MESEKLVNAAYTCIYSPVYTYGAVVQAQGDEALYPASGPKFQIHV